MEQGLHADHIDTTGAYAKRFQVIKELFENGTLTELPSEFRVKGQPVQQSVQTVEVTSNQNDEFNFYDPSGGRHADHTDETGRYRKAWEEKFGPMNDSWVEEGTNDDSGQNTQWKDFLQKLISEEKSKLNI